MSLREEQYRALIDTVHHGDLDKFKIELSKLSHDLLQLQYCYYTKSKDHVILLTAQLGRVEFLQVLSEHISCPNDLEYLLNSGNADGKTALHEACQFSQCETVAFLLNHGVKIDPIKRADWSPLALACTKVGPKAATVVKLLLDKGANTQLQNKVSSASFVIISCLYQEDISFHRMGGLPSTWPLEKAT